MKFFIVGRKNVILGRETANGGIIFTVGKTLSRQAEFATITRAKGDVRVQGMLPAENNAYAEEYALLVRAVKGNFGRYNIILDERICGLPGGTGRPTELKPKHINLLNIYNDPLRVPWNFEAAQAQNILSCFGKDPLIGKKTLYIGAGYGKNLWELQDGGRRDDIDAIEYSSLAVSRAMTIFGRRAIKRGNVLTLKAPKGKYDVILDIGCLHSIPPASRRKAAGILHSALKDDGLMISRIYFPRDNALVEGVPTELMHFGMTDRDIKEVFSDRFTFSIMHKNAVSRLLVFRKR